MESSIKKLALKESIIKRALEVFRDRMQEKREHQLELMEDAQSIDNETYEMTTESNKEEIYEEIDRRAEAMDTMQDELQNLARLAPTLQPVVGKGSVIITDKENFFVAASIPNFKVKDTKYVGISMEAPIFEEMKGKLAGDKVTFKKKTYEIRDVF